MKMTHNYPHTVSQNMTGKLTPEYQAEVDASTASLEASYAKEQKALVATERRLARAQARRSRAVNATQTAKIRREIRMLDELIEARRQELLRLSRLMTEVPAPSKNRGSGQVRQVSGAAQVRQFGSPPG